MSTPEHTFVPHPIPDSGRATVSGEAWNDVQRHAYALGRRHERRDTVGDIVASLRASGRNAGNLPSDRRCAAALADQIEEHFRV